MLAGIGAMGLLGTPGCAALTEESPRDVAEEGGPRESSSPTPQKEPINAGEPFSGEIAPGMHPMALVPWKRTMSSSNFVRNGVFSIE